MNLESFLLLRWNQDLQRLPESERAAFVEQARFRAVRRLPHRAVLLLVLPLAGALALLIPAVLLLGEAVSGVVAGGLLGGSSAATAIYLRQYLSARYVDAELRRESQEEGGSVPPPPSGAT